MFDIKEYNKFEKENKKTKFTFSQEELDKTNTELRVSPAWDKKKGIYEKVDLFEKNGNQPLNKTFYKFKLKKGLF